MSQLYRSPLPVTGIALLSFFNVERTSNNCHSVVASTECSSVEEIGLSSQSDVVNQIVIFIRKMLGTDQSGILW
jgi:hypothetical protein